MKLLHTADWHLGKSIEGKSRLEEQELFLRDFIQAVEREKPDLIMIAGDVYDSPNPPAKAEKLFYDTLKQLSMNGERLTIVIAGNHDSPERLSAVMPLASDHGIIMAGTPKTIVPAGKYGKCQVRDSGEGFIEIEIGNEKAVVLLVPFPSEKRLDEVLYGGMDDDGARLKSYGERMKLLFDSLSVNFREDTINLVLSHLFVMNSVEGGSERSIQLGGSYLVGGDVFPQKAQYIALGHIHKPQQVPGNSRARYSGAPLHYHKGEEAYEKQFLIIEVKVGQPCEIRSVPIVQYKPIECWNCKDMDEALDKCRQNSQRECWVYMEIETGQVILEHEIKQLKLLKNDILEIRPVFRGQREEMKLPGWQDKSFHQLFQEFYLHERGTEVSKETLQTLMELAGKEEYETDQA